jgi:hypothetical protein
MLLDVIMLNSVIKRRLVVCHYAECCGAKIFAEKKKKLECLAASKNFSNNFERKKIGRCTPLGGLHNDLAIFKFGKEKRFRKT